MNENIDLTKILKDCPMGWKFYSSVYGDVEFVEIYSKPVLCNPRPREDEWLGQVIHDCNRHVRFWTTNGFEHCVSSRGEMIKGCGECTFFPSRDQRDWSKFTAPWYKKERNTISCLEKQDEQEEPQVYETKDGKIITYSETDRYNFVEPKFHKGQWIACKGHCCC